MNHNQFVSSLLGINKPSKRLAVTVGRQAVRNSMLSNPPTRRPSPTSSMTSAPKASPNTRTRSPQVHFLKNEPATTKAISVFARDETILVHKKLGKPFTFRRIHSGEEAEENLDRAQRPVHSIYV